MPNKTWKSVERRVAAMLGGQRTGPEARGQGDVEVGPFYYEIKHMDKGRVPGLALFERTKALAVKRGKLPAVIYHPKGSQTYLITLELGIWANLLHDWAGVEDGDEGGGVA